jgi:hypothetical protein
MPWAAATITNDDGWDEGGVRAAKRSATPIPLSTDKTHPPSRCHPQQILPHHPITHAVSTTDVEDNQAHQWTCPVVTIHQGEQCDPSPLPF